MKDKSDRRKNSFLIYWYILSAILLFMIFIAYPIFWIFFQSLFSEARNGDIKFVSLQNYFQTLSNPIFWKAAFNMALWGFITVPIQMLMGGTIAYFIEFHTNKWKSFFRTAYFLPVVTSVSVVSLVWVHIYAPYYGIAQHYLSYMGIELESSLLGNTSTAIFALIIVNIWQWTGFSMLMYIAGFSSIHHALLDAAKIDGAKGVKFGVYIIAPLVSSTTRSLSILGVMGTLQTFPIVYIMTGGGPNRASEIFGTLIFKQSFVVGDLGSGSALSVIVLFIAFIFTVIQIGYWAYKSKQERRVS